jgi:hypothetical protein
MGMTLDQIEAEALALPEELRAKLVGMLLLSFEKANQSDDEVAQAWAEEAERRDEEMERGDQQGVPAEEVFDRLGSRLK